MMRPVGTRKVCMLLMTLLSAAVVYSSDAEQYKIDKTSELVSTMITVEAAVLHMEEDRYVPGNLLFSDDSSLKTTDGSTTDTIVGSPLSRAYREGTGTDAQFHWITGFIQHSANKVVVADVGNGCLRRVNRTHNRTQTYLGVCTSEGFRNGTSPLFSGPRSIIHNHMDNSTALLTDRNNNAIWTIDMVTDDAQVLVESAALSFPRGIVQDEQTGDLYITNENGVVKYDYTSGDLRMLSGSSAKGSDDGPLTQAQFDFPREILILAEKNLILADRNNHRLRVLDLQNNYTWSICSGVRGHKGGNFTYCEILRPDSLLVVGETLYVGERGMLSKIQRESKERTTTEVSEAETDNEDQGLGDLVIIALTVGVVLSILITSIICVYKLRLRRRSASTPSTPSAYTNYMSTTSDSQYPDEQYYEEVNDIQLSEKRYSLDEADRSDDEVYEQPIKSSEQDQHVYSQPVP